LVADVLIGAEEDAVSGFLSLLNQFTIPQFVPSDSARKTDFVVGETTRNWLRSPVIEEDFHQPKVGVLVRLSVAKRRTAFTSSGVTSKTSVISSSDIPA